MWGSAWILASLEGGWCVEIRRESLLSVSVFSVFPLPIFFSLPIFSINVSLFLLCFPRFFHSLMSLFLSLFLSPYFSLYLSPSLSYIYIYTYIYGIRPICRLHFGQTFENYPSFKVKNGPEKMDSKMCQTCIFCCP